MVRLDRSVVAATGPDAGAFLQGQLSQDVLAIPEGGSAWSWLLSPQGKVDALLRVTRRPGDEGWLLDTDGGWGEAVANRLNRFRLRTKIELVQLDWPVLGLRSTAEEWPADTADTGSLVVPWSWPGLDGWDLMGPDPVAPVGWPEMDADRYEAVRIAAGVPKMGAELGEKTIPAEIGHIDLTVSFAKGCYTGQELVARIDSRGGNVPRRLRRLVLEAAVDAGTDLYDGDPQVGTVTSVAATEPDGWVALGYVRRAVEVGATLRAGPNGPAVVVEELP